MLAGMWDLGRHFALSKQTPQQPNSCLRDTNPQGHVSETLQREVLSGDRK